MKHLGFAVTLCLMGGIAPACAEDGTPLAIVIHGGAGVINRSDLTPERETQYRAGLEAARDAGYTVLEKGGSSLDAVNAAVRTLEDNPLFNAGIGAVLNRDGEAELDSSIMDGATLRAGAVANLRHVKNPIDLARAVMEKSPHVMIAGAGAEEFALQQGFELVPNSYFRTSVRMLQLEKAQQEEKAKEKATGAPGKRTSFTTPQSRDGGSVSGHRNPSAQSDTARVLGEPGMATRDRGNSPAVVRPALQAEAALEGYGTVGAVALDHNGNLAAATSTGGMTNKLPGRIGDSPLIGAGTYANNASCAVSATGDGEFFIRAVVAYDLCARVQYKRMPLEAAAHEVIHEKIESMHATGGVIALDREGHIVMDFNSPGMFRAARDSSGRRDVAIFRNP